MKRIKEEFYCDRCGIKLAQNPMFYTSTDRGDVQIQKRYRVKILRNEWRSLDLCKSCKKSFVEWMKGEE